MFKIINNETATVEQLAQGYVEIENYLPEAETEHQDIKSKLEQAFINGEPKTKSNALKTQLSDCQIKIDACNAAMNQIRERITAQLPGEAKAQAEILETEFQTLKDEESELYKDFFTTCAKAIAILEKIKGVSYDNDHRSDTGVKVASPRLEVRAFHLMDPEDSVYFCEQTEKARKENGEYVPVRRRLDKVRNELHTLRTMTADYNPEMEVEKVLAAYR